MLQTTKGVVLHYIKYGESSVIVKIFTQHYGVQTYILKGIHSKKNKQQKAYLQPLSIVEIEASQQENKSIQFLKSIKIDYPYQSIPFNIYKSTIAFFIAELLTKTIKEEEANTELFSFIISSLGYLDEVQEHFSNFHLVFLAKLTSVYGFQPQLNTYKDKSYFNLQDSDFTTEKPNHPFFLCQENSQRFNHLFLIDFNHLHELHFSNSSRKEVLTALLDYYSIHIQNLSTLKTKDVLEDFFS